MKKNKSILVVVVSLFVVLCCSICLTGCKNNSLEIYGKEISNQKVDDGYVLYCFNDKIHSIVYGKDGKTYEIRFDTKYDISYSHVIDDCLILCGPGGCYQFNYVKDKVEKLKDEDINIVKKYNDELVYLENAGYQKENYLSVIHYKDKKIDIPYSVLSMEVYEDKFYLSVSDEYKKNENKFGYIVVDPESGTIENKFDNKEEGCLYNFDDNLYYATYSNLKNLNTGKIVEYADSIKDKISIFSLYSVDPIIYLSMIDAGEQMTSLECFKVDVESETVSNFGKGYINMENKILMVDDESNVYEMDIDGNKKFIAKYPEDSVLEKAFYLKGMNSNS